uniref:Uncharacterized protein n=1 Tax=Oryzias sinensis TaxID=183150 RepID=A0A8C8DVZ1_9TELE
MCETLYLTFRKILHFSSGETLEVEDSTDEELSKPIPFEEPAGRVGDLLENNVPVWSSCDFLGERFAGVFGLNAAKYQYAIDQYHRKHKVYLSKTLLEIYKHKQMCEDSSTYGAMANLNVSSNSTGRCGNSGGYLNKGYQENQEKSDWRKEQRGNLEMLQEDKCFQMDHFETNDG